MGVFEDADTPAFPVKEAAQLLGRIYNVNSEHLTDLIEQALAGQAFAGESDDLVADEDSSSHQNYAPLSVTSRDPEKSRSRLITRKLTRHANVGLSTQLELDGSVLVDNSRAFKKHSSAVRL